MVVDLLVGNAALALLAGGLILMALEALSPGAHLIVVGVALAGAGLIGLLVPGGLDILVLAGLTLVIGFAATWVYREFDFYGGKGTAQTSDSGSLAGATGYATETITERSGEVKLDSGGFSPYYTARTNDERIEEGEEVIVLDPRGGNVLTVESLSAIESDGIDRELARESTAESAPPSADPDESAEVDAEETTSNDEAADADAETEPETSG